MNLDFTQGIGLFNDIQELLRSNPASDLVKVVIAPSFILLAEFAKLTGSVSIAAQNCSSEKSGAFTGEVSAAMVKSTGAEYVIIGHSERRRLFNESDFILADKIVLALRSNLIPIFCVGETLDERNKKRHQEIVKKQIVEGLFHLNESEFARVILAYEPVWAIGTGVTATSAQAQEMHALIRAVCSDKYGSISAAHCPILYGGSCTAKNAKELFECPDIDGGLIGGASLKAGDFVEIVHSFDTTNFRK